MTFLFFGSSSFWGFILFFFCHGLFEISILANLFESETTQIRGLLVLFITAEGHPMNSIIMKATVFGRLRTTEVVSMHPESFKTSSVALDTCYAAIHSATAASAGFPASGLSKYIMEWVMIATPLHQQPFFFPVFHCASSLPITETAAHMERQNSPHNF